ncbi:hypothetical protein PIROE2DRAFT_1777, partial [Piromyces sp. E2]
LKNYVNTECVEGKFRGVLQDLINKDSDGHEEYSTMKEMKEALEEALEVILQEKCKRLQRCEDLEEEFEEAELAERAEERKGTNETVMSRMYTRRVY